MHRAFSQISTFHRAFGQNAPTAPILLDPATQQLRFDLIAEEFAEYREAVEQGNLVEVADALADLCYVVIGSAVAHGLVRFGDIFDEVHRSNMSKLGREGKPIRRADGKVLKGPAYTPPDLPRFMTPTMTPQHYDASDPSILPAHDSPRISIHDISTLPETAIITPLTEAAVPRHPSHNPTNSSSPILKTFSPKLATDSSKASSTAPSMPHVISKPAGPEQPIATICAPLPICWRGA